MEQAKIHMLIDTQNQEPAILGFYADFAEAMLNKLAKEHITSHPIQHFMDVSVVTGRMSNYLMLLGELLKAEPNDDAQIKHMIEKLVQLTIDLASYSAMLNYSLTRTDDDKPTA